MKSPMVELEIPGSIIFTVPTKTVSKYGKDLERIADTWYQIMEEIQWLVGYRFPKPMRYATDVEISIGGQHSGYPAMAMPLIGDFVDFEYIFSGDVWGLYHEIGHNLQESRWVPKDAGETTCNIIPVMVNSKLFNEDYTAKFYNSVKYFKKAGQTLKILQSRASHWEYLSSYVGPHFEFGWTPFKETFAEILKLPKKFSPNNDESKHSFWAKTMSLKTGHNLIPYFQWWAWEINQEAIDATKHLPVWEMVDNLNDKKCKLHDLFY